MKKMHWSKRYLKLATIEIVYQNGARQTWDYDCSQYEDIDKLKADMANDFKESKNNTSSIMLYFTRADKHHTVDLENTNVVGLDFANMVFDSIKTEIGEEDF